jgi:DNA-binding NarL/FixJ family response regulator
MLDPAMTALVLERIRRCPEQDDELRALTPQQRRILDLVGEGLTNREIARRMLLSEKTVKNYVSSMLAKLGFTSRTQAAVLAARHSGT